MQNKTRSITDGAMMCAIVGMALVLDRQMGQMILGYLMFALPLPMIFYSAKYGLKSGIIPLIGIAVISFILGTPARMIMAVSESILGWLYGSAIKAGWSSEKLLFISCGCGVAINFITTFALASLFGYDITAEIGEMEGLIKQFSDMGITLPQNFDRVLRIIYFCSVLLTGIIEGILTHLFAKLLLKRFRISFKPITPLHQINPPKITGYIALFCFVGLYIMLMKNISGPAADFLMGVGIMGMFYLAAFGYIAFIIFGKLFFPKAGFIIMLLAMFMLMTNSILMCLLGFLYITTDLKDRVFEWRRKLNEPKL